jgi:hypothetical protein
LSGPAAEIESYSLEKETHSFIVRIWNASDGAGAERLPGKGHPAGEKHPPGDERLKSRDESGWRGSIDYVGSGRRLYFYDMESIVRFIREQVSGNTGVPVPAKMTTLASLKSKLRASWEWVRFKKWI